MRAWIRDLVVVAVLAGLPSGADAQSRVTSGDLTGVVSDQTDSRLIGAEVSARNIDTNLTRRAVTDAEGRFALQALPPGTYELRASRQGFAPRTLTDVEVTLGSEVDVQFVLVLATLKESIAVSAVPPIVNSQKTEVSSVITRDQIERLPINRRNFMAFSLLTPGIAVDRMPQQGASATSGLSFSGQRARSNNITVDGLDNNDAVVGSVRATFSQDAVREFQVLTHSFSAEFGKAVGGVVNIVTRAGTNTFAGTAFSFFRDESLNAKDHFERYDAAGAAIDRVKAPYGQRQFGATIGGPLRKDRTFFFGSVERLTVNASNFVTIDDTNVVTVGGLPLGTPAQLLRNAGFAVETGHVPYRVDSDQALVRIDHQLSASQAINVRFNWADELNENSEPAGGLVARSRSGALDSRDYMLAGAHTAVLSARHVNEFRVQVADRDQVVYSLDPNCDGPCRSVDEGGPTVEVLGVASVGRQRFTPQGRANTRVQILDTLSYYTSHHQVRAGVDFNYINNNSLLPLHFGGRYIFSSLTAAQTAPFGVTGALSAIQALAAGIPSRYVQGYGTPTGDYPYKDVSLFVQDDWRLTPRLTAKLGLRYQRQFWPATPFQVSGYPAQYTLPADNNNVAPRVAMAWDPSGDRKTSVHAAYGLYFDSVLTTIVGATQIIDGRDRVRTFVAGLPTSVTAWRSPGHRLPESAAGTYPRLVISPDPGLRTPYAHQVAAGVDRLLPAEISLSANFIYLRSYDQLGTIDYNPIVAALGAGRRPEDVNGVAGTSASVLQYTSFGEGWYKGLALAVSKRFNSRYQFVASYTVSKSEDTSTDFQSEFIPQDNGGGRDDANPTGLPVGFNPRLERGPSVQDQRHRLVLSGVYVLPGDVELSGIITAASGRPYNILAGADLNGDGDGGSTDRARGSLADPASAVRRNAGTLPAEFTVDLRATRALRVRGVSAEGIFEVFNLFDRANFTSVNNVFGTGAYPANPLTTFGQFNRAAPPRQVQLGLRIRF